MIRATTALVWIVLAGSACAGDREPGPDTGDAALPAWTLEAEPMVDLGVGRGEARIFYNVASARLSASGDVYVLNRGSSEVRVFREDGAFLRAWGGAGDGPGEFSAPVTLLLVDGEVVVWDGQALRLSRFEPSGALIDTRSLAEALGGFFPGFAGVPDGPVGDAWTVLYHADAPEPGRLLSGSRQFLMSSGPDAPTLDTLARFPGEQRVSFDGRIPRYLRPFFSLTRISTNGLTTWALDGDTGHATRLSPAVAGDTASMPWTLGRVPVTPADLDVFRERTRDGWRESERDLEALIDLAPDTFPPADVLRVDSEGRIWVRRYRRPTEDAADDPHLWILGDPDGRPLRSVELPAELSPLDARGDRILVVHRDSLGVETVRIHRMIPSEVPS